MKKGVKRSRRLQATYDQEEAKAAKALEESAWKRGINTCGLPILPDELLLEILSYFPPIPLPSRTQNNIDTDAHVARRDALLALSRSCSNLRRFFHPYVWQRIEVCSGMNIGEKKLTWIEYGSNKEEGRAFALELIRQLEIVTIRDPTLAQYVHIVNVEITNYSVHSVVTELGRCLSLFTNLHTIKMRMFDIPATDMAARRGFQKHAYPQIRSAILSASSFPLLLSCPNLRTVHSIGNIATTYGIVEYLSRLPGIVRLKHQFLPRDLQGVAGILPNLQEIDIFVNDWYIKFADTRKLECIVLLKSLQTVTLDLAPQCDDHFKARIISIVKQHLLALQNLDGKAKCIRIRSQASWIMNEEVVLTAPGQASITNPRYTTP